MRVGIKMAVRRLFEHSKNEMIVAGRGKLKRRRYTLKLKVEDLMDWML